MSGIELETEVMKMRFQGMIAFALSLQLHRATGSVLLDNVCLVRYAK